MAAIKRKFVVPRVEDLDEERKASRPRPLFDTYKESSRSIEETNDDTCSRNTNVTDHKRDEKTGSPENTLKNDGSIVNKTSVPYHDQDLLSKESDLNSRQNIIPAALTSSCGSVKPTMGKTFKETFAFLEDTSHYKETVAKIKEKESNLEVKGPSASSKSKSNAVIVNPRQKGNPVLKHVRNVPWEMGDIIPDYVLGPTTCALFLSLRYHHFNPEYIHERLRQLGQKYELRILLVQVDVKDPHQTLRELAKMAMMADCTLMLAWSPEEAGRYLETYKVYENKPPDALLGQSEGDYHSKLTDCLTTVKGINKTDVVSLSSTFGSLANMATASKEDLALLPGFGPLKAQRLHNLIQQPFVAKKTKETGDDKTSTADKFASLDRKIIELYDDLLSQVSNPATFKGTDNKRAEKKDSFSQQMEEHKEKLKQMSEGMSELDNKVSHLRQDMSLYRRQLENKRGDDELVSLVAEQLVGNEDIVGWKIALKEIHAALNKQSEINTSVHHSYATLDKRTEALSQKVKLHGRVAIGRAFSKKTATPPCLQVTIDEEPIALFNSSGKSPSSHRISVISSAPKYQPPTGRLKGEGTTPWRPGSSLIGAVIIPAHSRISVSPTSTAPGTRMSVEGCMELLKMY